MYLVEMNGKNIMFLGDVFNIGAYGEKAWIGDQWFLDSDYDNYMRSLYKLMHIHADILLSAHMQGCLRDGDVRRSNNAAGENIAHTKRV